MSKSGSIKLPRSFFLQPTLDVARGLIDKTIVYNSPQGLITAKIVETEAYIGEGDPACHAARGKTPRNAVMFGPGGYSYIYFIYGMYHCLNVVTEKEGFPAAVLIRAAEPIEGLDIIKRHSPQSDKLFTNGPGKLCRAFGLTRDQNGLDLLGDELIIVSCDEQLHEIKTSPRIGIKQATQREWRFFANDSPYISR